MFRRSFLIFLKLGVDNMQGHNVLFIMQGQNRIGGVRVAKKVGRPPLQKTSRSEDLNIRLTKQEKEDIQYCAEKLEVSRTDAIMKGISLLKKEIGE